MTGCAYEAAVWCEGSRWLGEVITVGHPNKPHLMGRIAECGSRIEMDAALRTMIAQEAGCSRNGFALELLDAAPVFLRLGNHNPQRCLGWLQHPTPVSLAVFLRSVADALDLFPVDPADIVSLFDDPLDGLFPPGTP